MLLVAGYFGFRQIRSIHLVPYDGSSTIAIFSTRSYRNRCSDIVVSLELVSDSSVRKEIPAYQGLVGSSHDRWNWLLDEEALLRTDTYTY